MMWVTRAGGNVDRVACPWLIKHFIATFLLAVVSTALATGCGSPPTSPSTYLPAPDVTLVRQDGTRFPLSEYRGKKYVVLLFMRGFTGEFACAFCSTQTIAYRAAYEDFAAEGAEVIEVLPGTPETKLIPDYLNMIADNDESKPAKPFTVPFPVTLDPDLSATKAFGIPTEEDKPFPVSAPATFIIDPEGRIRYAYRGEKPKDRPTPADVLEELKRAKAGLPPRSRGPAEAPVGQAEAPSAPSLAWETSLEKGLARAAQEKKPLLVDFYADW